MEQPSSSSSSSIIQPFKLPEVYISLGGHGFILAIYIVLLIILFYYDFFKSNVIATVAGSGFALAGLFIGADMYFNGVGKAMAPVTSIANGILGMF